MTITQSIGRRCSTREELQKVLEERKEYEEFCAWCDEHNPNGWMSFEDFQEVKRSAEANEQQAAE